MYYVEIVTRAKNGEEYKHMLLELRKALEAAPAIKEVVRKCLEGVR